MSRYEKIRREIIAIEREIVMLKYAVKSERDRSIFQDIDCRSGWIYDSFNKTEGIQQYAELIQK